MTTLLSEKTHIKSTYALLQLAGKQFTTALKAKEIPTTLETDRIQDRIADLLEELHAYDKD